MSAVSDLLSDYQHIIERLELVMGGAGVFDVVVDGELLFSKKRIGRHAEPGEVLELFIQRYGQGVARYGT